MLNVHIIDTIITLSNRCSAEKEKSAINIDLSNRETSILLSINEGENISSSDLAHRNHLSLSRMSRLIDGLYTKKYIKRTTSPTDRRSINVSLTTKGTDARKKIISANHKCEKKICERLTDSEMKHVQEALKILLNATQGVYNGQGN